jgi:SAM-dependent methyltransferase
MDTFYDQFLNMSTRDHHRAGTARRSSSNHPGAERCRDVVEVRDRPEPAAVTTAESPGPSTRSVRGILPGMCASSWRRRVFVPVIGVMLLASPRASAQTQPQPPQRYEPQVGQAGRDVVWVPTPEALVEKMLDMAKVTKDDLVMDLGSGDGRNIIAAAKRGARAIGVEYNPDMVRLSRQLADEAGVGARASFIEGDMFTADISKATVMALFLLPTNLEKLRDTFLALRPGTRMVLNTFAVPEWEPDAQETIGGDCVSWCTSLLYYVPAKVDGRWQTSRGELTLKQTYQMVTGTLTEGGRSTPVTGRLRGAEIELTVAGEPVKGTVTGDRLDGPLAGTRLP